MKKLYFAIQLLEVLCLGYGALTYTKYNQLYPDESVASLGPAGDGESMRLKRETSTTWTVRTFAECSDSCGGGLRTRSVRCLDEDGVISDDCSPSDRPDGHDFCNQIDCATDTYNSSLLPASGTYTFNSGEYSSVLQFINKGSGSYMLQLNTTESDGTGTTLKKTVTTENTLTELGRIPLIFVTNIVNSAGNYFLEFDGKNILDLSNIERSDVPSDESLNDFIFIGSGDTVERLTYLDELRYYIFTTNTVNPLNGPGTLYYNPDTFQALYSIVPSLNEDLDIFIQSIANDATEVTPTLFQTSPTPDETTTSVSVETTFPPGTPSTTGSPATTTFPIYSTHPTTAVPPSPTEIPTLCDDDSSSSHSRHRSHFRRNSRRNSRNSGRNSRRNSRRNSIRNSRRTLHSRRSPHSRKTPHSRSSCNTPDSSGENPTDACDDDSTSSSSKSSKPSRTPHSSSNSMSDVCEEDSKSPKSMNRRLHGRHGRQAGVSGRGGAGGARGGGQGGPGGGQRGSRGGPGDVRGGDAGGGAGGGRGGPGGVRVGDADGGGPGRGRGGPGSFRGGNAGRGVGGGGGDGGAGRGRGGDRGGPGDVQGGNAGGGAGGGGAGEGRSGGRGGVRGSRGGPGGIQDGIAGGGAGGGGAGGGGARGGRGNRGGGAGGGGAHGGRGNRGGRGGGAGGGGAVGRG